MGAATATGSDGGHAERMGILVSAAEAGALVGRHERIVRGKIKAGRLPRAHKGERGAWRVDTDDLAAIPGWRVDPVKLAALEGKQRATPAGLAAQVEALRAELRQTRRDAAILRARLTHLEDFVLRQGVGASGETFTPAPASRSDEQEAALQEVGAMVTPVNASRPSSGRTWGADDDVSQGTVTPTYQPRRAAPTLRLSSSLPDGLVSWRAFAKAHRLPETTVSKALDAGRLPSVAGKWKDGRAYVLRALDADGRRAFYALWGDRPDFARCAGCPHA